jgi:hypothetical protein
MPVIVSPACRSTTLELLVVVPLNATDDKTRIFFISFSMSFFIFGSTFRHSSAEGWRFPRHAGNFETIASPGET